MKKPMAPKQLSLNFDEPHDFRKGALSDLLVVGMLGVPIGIEGCDGKVVKLERFVAGRRQADKDVVYRQILDSVRFI